jgi:hypothetical protein
LKRSAVFFLLTFFAVAPPAQAVVWQLSHDDPAVRACFDANIVMIAGTERSYTVHLEFGDDGRVTTVAVSGGDVAGTPLESCLIEAFLAMGMDPPPSGDSETDVAISYRVFDDDDLSPDEGPEMLLEIDEVVRAGREGIGACLQASATSLPADVRLLANFVIAPDGVVIAVDFLESNTDNPTFESCLSTHLQGLTFPRPPSGEVAQFDFPLSFTVWSGPAP